MREECKCNGKISKCDHSKHGMITTFGDVRNLFTGEVVYRHSDPSWTCTGCGMPVEKASAEPHTGREGAK